MPNHVHLIIVIEYKKDAENEHNPFLSNIVGQFKSGVSREIGESVWQTRFHDHVIRNEKAYLKIWDYIEYNPLLWKKDMFYC